MWVNSIIFTTTMKISTDGSGRNTHRCIIIMSFGLNIMSHKTIVLLSLAALAIFLYVIGFKTGTLAVFIMAVLVELVFWFNLIKKKTNSIEINEKE